jgi:hypothetical protein
MGVRLVTEGMYTIWPGLNPIKLRSYFVDFEKGFFPQHIRLLFAYTHGMSRYTKATHTVYLHFMSNQSGWHCQFLEADLKTSLPCRFTFASADKIRELARRGEAWGNLESKQALEHAIEMGRGGIYLRLTPEQYARLKRR